MHWGLISALFYSSKDSEIVIHLPRQKLNSLSCSARWLNFIKKPKTLNFEENFRIFRQQSEWSQQLWRGLVGDFGAARFAQFPDLNKIHQPPYFGRKCGGAQFEKRLLCILHKILQIFSDQSGWMWKILHMSFLGFFKIFQYLMRIQLISCC